MSRLTCLACGLESSDVAPTIVEYADPIPVTVHVPVSARANAIEMARSVPGRYGAEWRCRDVAACRRRAADAMGPIEPWPRDASAAEPMSEPEPAAAVVADAAADVSDIARVEPEGSWFS